VEHALGRRLRMPPYILPRGSAKAQPETLCRSEA
jgi:hypothetical protein